jgi:hypothetical protein
MLIQLPSGASVVSAGNSISSQEDRLPARPLPAGPRSRFFRTSSRTLPPFSSNFVAHKCPPVSQTIRATSFKTTAVDALSPSLFYTPAPLQAYLTSGSQEKMVRVVSFPNHPSIERRRRNLALIFAQEQVPGAQELQKSHLHSETFAAWMS